MKGFIMNNWKEVYKGMIPKDTYKTWITNSEEKSEMQKRLQWAKCSIWQNNI